MPSELLFDLVGFLQQCSCQIWISSNTTFPTSLHLHSHLEFSIVKCWRPNDSPSSFDFEQTKVPSFALKVSFFHSISYVRIEAWDQIRTILLGLLPRRPGEIGWIIQVEKCLGDFWNFKKYKKKNPHWRIYLYMHVYCLATIAGNWRSKINANYFLCRRAFLAYSSIVWHFVRRFLNFPEFS